LPESGAHGERRAPLIPEQRCNDEREFFVIETIQRRMAARRNDEDHQGGFTLIELMVVVMIIAILVGIAIPAFLGARKRAQDTASKSNLRNALGTAQTLFTDNQTFLASNGVMEGKLGDEEPALKFLPLEATASAAPKEISVKTRTSAVSGATGLDEIVLASKSASGKCFYLRHINTAGDSALSGSYQAESKTEACTGAQGDTSATLVWNAL
jgi:prepilin-type N-terminal cleavage/methylation domain-containing protein